MPSHLIAVQIAADIEALPRAYTPELRELRKRWSATLRSEVPAQVLEAAMALERESPQERKWVAYELIRFHPWAFATVGEAQAEDFAGRIASWYATDAFGTILSGPLWAKARLPDAMFDAWSHSESRWLRRSALVATVGRNATKPDPASTFALCLRLAADRDDMVEKAVSWALRYLSQKDRPAVEAFWAEHGDSFAPRVKREVRHKLATGVKNPRRSGGS
jgi:3-methyladenine DNA glycosylase AlkD